MASNVGSRIRARPSRVATGDDVESDDEEETKLESRNGLHSHRKLPLLSVFACSLFFFLSARLVWLRYRNPLHKGVVRRLSSQTEHPGPWHLRQPPAKVVAELGNGGHVWRGDPHVEQPVSVQEALRIQLLECPLQPSARPGAETNNSAESVLLDRLACVFQTLYAQGDWGATYGLHQDNPAKIYGEIPPESVQKLMVELHIDSSSVFYDLGSGVGRMVLQVYLTTPVKTAIGVEVERPRHDVAAQALKALQRADMKTLLPKSGNLSNRRASFVCANFTDLNISEATAVYVASLYFPKNVMMLLAGKLAQLRDGSRIMMLTKFPFDLYGARHLPADSPMQALRYRGKVDLRMTWSEENSVFIYEVDRNEAWPPKFDGAGATPEALLAEVCRRSHINRPRLERPSVQLAEAALHAVQSLKPSTGDEICELGTSTGWLILRLAVETDVGRLVGICEGSAEAADIPGKAKKALDELAPGRIPWFRRIEFDSAESLRTLLVEGTDGNGRPGSDAFTKSCGGATMVIVSDEMHPEALVGGVSKEHNSNFVMSALPALANRMAAGTIIIVATHSTQPICIPGLWPLASNKGGDGLALSVFAVAPHEIHVAKLGLPGLGNNLLEAVLGGSGIHLMDFADKASNHLLGTSAELRIHDLESLVAHHDVHDVFDSGVFRRLQQLLGGLTISRESGRQGSLEAVQGSNSNRQGISAKLLSRLYLARFFGGAESPCVCVELTVVISMDQADLKDLGDLCEKNASRLMHFLHSAPMDSAHVAVGSRERAFQILRQRFPALVK